MTSSGLVKPKVLFPIAPSRTKLTQVVLCTFPTLPLLFVLFPLFDSSSALFQHITALFECSAAALVTLLVSDPVGGLSIRSCRVQMLSDWYTMLYNPSPDYVTTLHCTQEAVFPLWVVMLWYMLRHWHLTIYMVMLKIFWTSGQKYII